MLALQLVAAEAEGGVPSIVFGVGAFTVLVVLLLITLSLNRHR